MPVDYIINVTDEVEAALQKKAIYDGVTTNDLLQKQLEYYIACALYADFDPNIPFNTPGLSIYDRLEVYAVYTNQGIEAARARVIEILSGL